MHNIVDMDASFIGLDLGERQDFTAMCLVTMHGFKKQIIGGKRFPINTGYPQIIEDVVKICNTKLNGEVFLGIDATGVGLPVVQMFMKAKMKEGVHIIPVLITSGFEAHIKDGILHVPKKELVYNLQLDFANDYIDIAPIIDKTTGENISEIIKEEASNLRPKVTKTNEMTYTHRDGTHDDLILAVAIAVYLASNNFPNGFDKENQEGRSKEDVKTGDKFTWL